MKHLISIVSEKMTKLFVVFVVAESGNKKLTKSRLGMILSMYVTTMCMHCLICVSNSSIYFKFDQGKQNLNALCSFVLFLFSIPLSAYGQGHKPAMNM